MQGFDEKRRRYSVVAKDVEQEAQAIFLARGVAEHVLLADRPMGVGRGEGPPDAEFNIDRDADFGWHRSHFRHSFSE
ncbi:MAG: hypothetical protein ABI224_14695 [Acetobacteraceae bacterium]